MSLVGGTSYGVLNQAADGRNRIENKGLWVLFAHCVFFGATWSIEFMFYLMSAWHWKMAAI